MTRSAPEDVSLTIPEPDPAPAPPPSPDPLQGLVDDLRTALKQISGNAGSRVSTLAQAKARLAAVRSIADTAIALRA